MIYGCIGKTLKHSYSAKIHRLLGDADYRLIELAEDEVGLFLKEKNFSAVNVTIPYKETVIPYLNRIDESAKAIGSVNTVVNENGILLGYNTDFYGMTALLSHANIDVKGKTVAVLGSGGTSKTAKAVCLALMADKVLTVSRTPKGGQISYNELYSLHGSIDIIVNTTPVGMYPKNGECPIRLDAFSNLSGVIDAVYNPLRTTLIAEARARGIPSEGGLYMLCAQGVKASEFFHHRTYPQEALERVYRAVLEESESLVLIGMPGAGKTTVGRLLAEKTSREFFDSDEIFRQKYGDIPSYFQKYGEESFREKESEILRDLSKIGGIVLATGGGAVLRQENVDTLVQNGKLIFLDRDPDAITADEKRPTASSKEKIRKTYEERIVRYRKAADFTVKIHEKDGLPDAADAVKQILNERGSL